MQALQLLERVDGVGHTRPLGLDGADREAIVLCGKQPRHCHTGGHRRHVLVELEVRVARGHEEDARKAERVCNTARKRQMPQMRRVEGAAEHRYRLAASRHYPRTWPSPMSTNLLLVSSRRPMGPRAWSFWVEMPISAPSPNSPPSVKRVDALQ